MPQITIQNINNKSVPFQDSSKTVLNIFQDHQLDWMHACGGKGRCTTCKMIVVEGAAKLSAPSPFEEKMERSRRLLAGERLACQCRPFGNICLRVPEENKLPHITYTD